MALSARQRVQQVFASSHFTNGPILKGPILIRALRWRPSSPIGHAFTNLVAQLQIHLSTTQADPEELALNFSANTGEDDLLVFNGNIALSSAFAGPPLGPKEFDIVVPLTTPFVYRPARGHLLIDIRNFSNNGISPLDAAIRTNDLGSRAFAANPNATQATGRDIACDILAVDYSLLSEQPSVVWSPQSHLVVPGEPTTLRLIASGTAPLSYQWWLNGTPIEGATNTLLSIPSVQPGHEGSYTVQIANAFGSATSLAASLRLVSDGARVVVPNFATNQLGGTAATTFRGPLRIQQIYGSNHFRQGTIAIREIRFRADSAAMVDGTATIPDLQVNLSTTLVPGETPTGVFTNNSGLDVTTVFHGAVSILSGAGPRVGALQPFDIVIPFDTPYVYEPTFGHLVVDMRIPSGFLATRVDTSLRGNDSSGRAYNSDLAASLASVDGGSDVVQLVYSPTSAPPAVLFEPQSLTRVPGESAGFRVRVKGTPPLAYQWFHNGQPLAGRTNANLSLLNVRETNAGLYSVRVENSFGDATSASASLGILTNGVLAVIPREYGGQTGGNGSGTFESRIRQQMYYAGTNFPGGPILLHGFRWRPNAAEGRAFNPTTIDIQIALSTARDWTRTFADNRGADSTEVFRGPIALSSGFGAAVAGSKQFDVFVPFQNLFPFDPTKGDLLVETKHFANAVTSPVDAGGAPSAAGRVWSDDPEGTTATTGRGDVDILQVLYTPVIPASILVGPQDLTVPEGSPVTLSVSAGGTPPIYYQWRFNSALLAGQTNNVLTLADAQTNQSGLYSVVVSNFAGGEISADARLTVFHVNLPPTAVPQELSLAEDSVLALVLAASDPEGDALTYSFSVPAHGTLSGAAPNLIYRPATNYFGPDTFTFQANDGALSSVPATVRLTILPVNDTPIATSASLTTPEDTPLAIKLQTVDVDGDKLTYSINSPSHGALSGVAPNLLYTPKANYYGEDQFTYVVRDGTSASSTGVVRVAIAPVNDPPVARASVGPLLQLLPNSSDLLILSSDNIGAAVILDGSLSFDPEDDALQFNWIVADSGALLATAERATNTFTVGSHSITLHVSDGNDTAVDVIEFEVITAGEALEVLIFQIMESDLERRQTRPLVASVKAAIASFERGNRTAGSKQLAALEHKITSQIRPIDTAIAERLLDSIGQILAAVNR